MIYLSFSWRLIIILKEYRMRKVSDKFLLFVLLRKKVNNFHSLKIKYFLSQHTSNIFKGGFHLFLFEYIPVAGGIKLTKIDQIEE